MEGLVKEWFKRAENEGRRVGENCADKMCGAALQILKIHSKEYSFDDPRMEKFRQPEFALPLDHRRHPFRQVPLRR